MSISTVLVVGATGNIGRLVTAEAIRQDYRTRALARDPSRAAQLDGGVEIVAGDLTRPESLHTAVDGVDAVIFTHGADGSEQTIEQVSYGGVRDILALLTGSQVRIVLMSAVGVTARTGMYNASHLADWKRRAERIVRASGQPYTILRPGWFDANGPDEQQLVMRQGDRHHAGSPSDGAVARQQIAQVLVAALASPTAVGKTFELVAEPGPATRDLEPLFTALPADPDGALDGVGDAANMPLEEEPQRVRDDLQRLDGDYSRR
ncbi:SDR family oxidoreductase [Streptomyces ipomoeae]|uniref:NAD dependent epimerase/dehydratase family protein n=1 Tax=Streptomyces ipomoeae 91-03 TaxID=698759 RepID=I3P658_9ACTN|nr:SDR family oxidoreductase [Streptomyces ipomoeae]AEL30548.1 NAD-dependent epimerase/dehydratase [Streptomyces ipomoeae 91-03]EKX60276.1 NAD dependent epimerase/dehydratase family protein [Streptomyces ipomoeae 91-03]MDX2698767.1 SDR family oxidoreductase [Streptomyces ipomoeae]MDX2844423.1 SDR family oxidoreductase [Streptomyces ipomoeae]